MPTRWRGSCRCCWWMRIDSSLSRTPGLHGRCHAAAANWWGEPTPSSEAESRIRHRRGQGACCSFRWHFYPHVRLGRTRDPGVCRATALLPDLRGDSTEGLSSRQRPWGRRSAISASAGAGQVTPAAKALWRPFAILAEPVFNRPPGLPAVRGAGRVSCSSCTRPCSFGLGLRGASDHQLRWRASDAPEVWPRQLARTLLFMVIYWASPFLSGPLAAWYGLNRLADPC
jgi:hypothetical protein